MEGGVRPEHRVRDTVMEGVEEEYRGKTDWEGVVPRHKSS